MSERMPWEEFALVNLATQPGGIAPNTQTGSIKIKAFENKTY